MAGNEVELAPSFPFGCSIPTPTPTPPVPSPFHPNYTQDVVRHADGEVGEDDASGAGLVAQRVRQQPHWVALVVQNGHLGRHLVQEVGLDLEKWFVLTS